MLNQIIESINTIWPKELETLTKELNLPEIKLEIINENTNMFGETLMTVTRQGFSLLDAKVLDVEFAGKIKLNIKGIANALRMFPIGSRKIITPYFVRHVILHELKHVHQIFYAKELVIAQFDKIYSIEYKLFGNGNESGLPAEVDADDFAVNRVTGEEKLVAEAIVNLHGRDNKGFVKAIKHILLHHTAPKVAKVAAVAGVGYLLYKLITKKKA